MHPALLPAAPMFAHFMVPFGLTTSIRDVCPFATHTIPLTSMGGLSPTGSTYSHCTLLQLSPAKEPEYLTSIIMPTRCTKKPLPSYRVTESYAAPMMSLSHARCRLLSTDKSGRR